MKLSKTPLALALAMALASPVALASVVDNPKRSTHEVEETGRHADSSRPDVVLLTKVKSKLAMSDTVSALDINVDVEDDVVSLRGTVDNQAQADEAVRLARDTVGVNRVRSHLVINPRASDDQKERNMRSPEDRREDWDRRDRSERAMDRDHRRDRDRDHRGDMDRAERERQMHERNRKHRDMDGSRDRDGTSMERPDAWVLTKVKAKMLADDRVGGLGIDVNVHDGVVYLYGNVATREEARQAERLARETEGVKRVRSSLEVRGD